MVIICNFIQSGCDYHNIPKAIFNVFFAYYGWHISYKYREWMGDIQPTSGFVAMGAPGPYSGNMVTMTPQQHWQQMAYQPQMYQQQPYMQP